MVDFFQNISTATKFVEILFELSLTKTFLWISQYVYGSCMSASYNVCDGINTGIMILWGKWPRKFPPFVNYNILHNGYTIMYSSVNKNCLLPDTKPVL